MYTYIFSGDVVCSVFGIVAASTPITVCGIQSGAIVVKDDHLARWLHGGSSCRVEIACGSSASFINFTNRKTSSNLKIILSQGDLTRFLNGEHKKLGTHDRSSISHSPYYVFNIIFSFFFSHLIVFLADWNTSRYKIRGYQTHLAKWGIITTSTSRIVFSTFPIPILIHNSFWYFESWLWQRWSWNGAEERWSWRVSDGSGDCD